METIKQYLTNHFTIEEIKEIANHGCAGGVGGFIYYNETVAFHDAHEEEIWDMLYEDAEGQDCTVMELIATFGGQKDVGSMTQLKNLLVWYAVERDANAIINDQEEG